MTRAAALLMFASCVSWSRYTDTGHAAEWRRAPECGVEDLGIRYSSDAVDDQAVSLQIRSDWPSRCAGTRSPDAGAQP